MKRILTWNRGQFDEIELVYEKAEENEAIGNLMEQLEEKALAEARENCGMLKTSSGAPITPEQFDGLSQDDKETVIKALSGAGLASIGQEINSATITIRLSAYIQRVMACTIFDILNRLEKLDGAINILKPKWTLELQTPLGGKKGLFQWEMLIMQLYPWISVRETSVNEVAAGTVPEKKGPEETAQPKADAAKKTAQAEKTSAPEKTVQPEKKAPQEPAGEEKKEEKKSFWKKMFGR